MANEKQKISFNGAKPDQFFGFRAAGTEQAFQIRLAEYSTDTALRAAFKAGVESLPSYAGRTVTVTGSLTGSATRSGDLSLEYDGGVDVPLLEVFSGAVHRFHVAGGDGGNYSFGGAGFTLPITQSAFDANQEAIDAAHAGSVSIGGSNYTTTVHITGSGPAVGDYTENGVKQGNKLYTASDGRKIFGAGDGQWWITSADETIIYAQIPRAGSLTPNPGTWIGHGSDGPDVQSSGTPITLDFDTYFPILSNPGAPVASGGGASASLTVERGQKPNEIDDSTPRPGGILNDTKLPYNYVSVSGASAVIDRQAATSSGWSAQVQIIDSRDDTATLALALKGSTTGAFAGEETTIASLAPQSYRGAWLLHSADAQATLPRYVRVVSTVAGGTNAGFALAFFLSSRYLGDL